MRKGDGFFFLSIIFFPCNVEEKRERKKNLIGETHKEAIFLSPIQWNNQEMIPSSALEGATCQSVAPSSAHWSTRGKPHPKQSTSSLSIIFL